MMRTSPLRPLSTSRSAAPRRGHSALAALARLAALVFVTLTLVACKDPCVDLEKKVCDDPKYLKTNKKHCDLMQDQARRENLPKDACKGILDFLTKR